MRPEELAEQIDAVVVTFDDGSIRELTTRPGSANHFFEVFSAGTVDVRLRLDWGDRDAKGQPTLDADFLDPTTQAHLRNRTRGRRVAHHTQASAGDGRRYEWRFDETEKAFNVAVSWRAAVSERLDARDTYDATVQPNARRDEGSDT